MNPAGDSPNSSAKKNINSTSVNAASFNKEREPFSGPVESINGISQEIEVPIEVERAGVKKVHEAIDVPPDLGKLGVLQSGPSVPIAQSTVVPSVTLPISDTQVLVGLHSQVSSSLKWLAAWCIKKLKKAHVALKIIHGKIVRVLIK